ncbi:MAG: hypothetical protein PHV74_00105 [Dehalococcoidia bacterium]|nr:hypothetical protein [Dehalococcoidia bacterium]
MDIECNGLDELVKKLRPDTLIGPPVRKAMQDASILMEGEAKKEIKRVGAVDTGRFMGSVTHSVAPDVVPLWARVGTSVEYAPDIEYGQNPHTVPLAELKPWARRKGISENRVGAIQQSIREVGTKPRYPFRNTFRKNIDDVKQIFKKVLDDIENRFGK